jgi:hypothetical protein
MIQQEKAQKKRESVIALDLESLKISGEFADGVEAMVQVGSIFSENAKIGVLIEALAVSFCDAWIFKSSRMQLSRIPISVSDSHPDKKLQSAAVCDWVIQCRDANICLPFRLQLRKHLFYFLRRNLAPPAAVAAKRTNQNQWLFGMCGSSCVT